LQAGATVSAGWVLGFALPGGEAQAQASFAPNAFLRIGADDSITVLIGQTEMGQGISTGLAMALAEELEADWSKEDMQQDFYRPANAVRFKAGLDAQGVPIALSARVAGSGPLIYSIARRS
jgi:isoquinoline 1-oxidoreductase beta subunit